MQKKAGTLILHIPLMRELRVDFSPPTEKSLFKHISKIEIKTLYYSLTSYIKSTGQKETLKFYQAIIDTFFTVFYRGKAVTQYNFKTISAEKVYVFLLTYLKNNIIKPGLSDTTFQLLLKNTIKYTIALNHVISKKNKKIKFLNKKNKYNNNKC